MSSKVRVVDRSVEPDDLRIRVDTSQTEERVRKLGQYMDEHVWRQSAGMCCRHYLECKDSVRGYRFDEGQLSHVGRHYDLTVGSSALRIVVVGQEPGLWPRDATPRKGVSLEDRYKLIHDESGLGARYYATGRWRSRNPHMRGTTSALRILLGRGLGKDHEGEFLVSTDGERFHIFDAFALVNVLICSAGPHGSSQGRSTAKMRTNCREHFDVTMRILEPTIVVLQGRGVRRWLEPSINSESSTTTDGVSRAKLAGVDVVVCSFTHPSARGEHGWGNRLDGSYLLNTVSPALHAALRASPQGHPERKRPATRGTFEA